MDQSLLRPWRVVGVIMGVFLVSLLMLPLLGVAFFPRSDAGQFVINLKAPTGTRIEVTEKLVDKVEEPGPPGGEAPRPEIDRFQHRRGTRLLRRSTPAIPDPTPPPFRWRLTEDHKIGSYEYMDRVRRTLAPICRRSAPSIQSGGLQDAVLNQGLPAPIDLQVSRPGPAVDLQGRHRPGQPDSQPAEA